MKISKGLAALLLLGVLLLGVSNFAQYNWSFSQNELRGVQPNRNYGQFYGQGMMRGFAGRGMMNGYGYGNGYNGMMGGFAGRGMMNGYGYGNGYNGMMGAFGGRSMMNVYGYRNGYSGMMGGY